MAVPTPSEFADVIRAERSATSMDPVEGLRRPLAPLLRLAVRAAVMARNHRAPVVCPPGESPLGFSPSGLLRC